jgi:endoglycosylceramidase
MPSYTEKAAILGRSMLRGKHLCASAAFFLLSVCGTALAGDMDLPITATPSGFHDSLNRSVILRGFVVLPVVNNQRIVYDDALYAEMQELGADYQSIRLDPMLLGGWADATGQVHADASYLEMLRQMVALGKRHGIRTSFKMTLIGVPQRQAAWQSFWQNAHGEQALYAAGWKNIWQAFAKEPAVIGYDLLNEAKADQGANPQDFTRSTLVPCYQHLIDVERDIDKTHAAFFQALFVPHLQPLHFVSLAASIDRPNIVYAPHFYVDIQAYNSGRDVGFETYSSDYSQAMTGIVSDARQQHATLMIGEFGDPWSPDDDENAAKIEQYRQLEIVAAKLFDREGLGYSRPWFSNEVPGLPHGQGGWATWGLIKGRGDLHAPLRAFITNILARPYPEAVAGSSSNFAFDFPTAKFTASYRAQGDGVSEFMVPAANYPKGFEVTLSSGARLVVMASGAVQTGQAKGLNFDQATRILSISGIAPNQDINLTIMPLGNAG